MPLITDPFSQLCVMAIVAVLWMVPTHHRAARAAAVVASTGEILLGRRRLRRRPA